MVVGMKVVCDESSKKEGVIFHYLEIDFGYRKAKIFEIDKLMLPELCGVTAEVFYKLKPGQSLPVRFDLPAIHNEVHK